MDRTSVAKFRVVQMATLSWLDRHSLSSLLVELDFLRHYLIISAFSETPIQFVLYTDLGIACPQYYSRWGGGPEGAQSGLFYY